MQQVSMQKKGNLIVGNYTNTDSNEFVQILGCKENSDTHYEFYAAIYIGPVNGARICKVYDNISIKALTPIHAFMELKLL